MTRALTTAALALGVLALGACATAPATTQAPAVEIGCGPASWAGPPPPPAKLTAEAIEAGTKKDGDAKAETPGEGASTVKTYTRATTPCEDVE